uniref:Capsid protein n=1 Tax=Helenium virus S TaxID=12171 RepID=A0A7U0RA87_HELVS|nr:CP [Helenium virus S]QQX32709.1 CP [Helenium virus S]
MPPKVAPESSDTAGNQEQQQKPPPATPPVPTPPPGRREEVEDRAEDPILQRLESLTALLRSERSAVRVTNASFETGRPALQPTADMRGDVTNMYNRPSTDSLWAVKPKPISNNMATSEDMVKIKVALEGLGVPTEHITGIIYQLCFYCASTSSSSYQDPKGVFEWPGGAIMVDDVMGKVQEIAGIRRVCRLYAPVTWNYMHIHDSPPSDWASMGFAPNVKYAAFDCFDYVENPAAVQPLGGVIPRPTRDEYVAYNAYKLIVLNKANNNDTYSNFSAQITGGRMGPTIEHNFNNANNRKQ